MSGPENRLIRLLRSDSYLTPFSDKIRHRLENIEETEHRLTQGKEEPSRVCIWPRILRSAFSKRRMGISGMGAKRNSDLPDRRYE